MVGADELQGQSKATVTSDRAQQILAAYNAYKASGGQSAPQAVPKPEARPMASNTPQINISQVQLQKTNALRAQQDLPPLQEVSNVKVIEPTHTTYSKPQQSVPQPEKIKSEPQVKTEVLTTGQKLAQAQGSVQPIGGGGEAVSFLRYPFSSNKGPSSGGIQSTIILDPLQFLGIESGVSLATKGGEVLLSFLRSGAGKEIIKIGTKDIGLNIKPSEAYLKAKSFETQASRLPPPASVKPVSPPKVPTVPIFTSNEISLGKGLVKTVGKGGGTATDLIKPSSPPPSTPPKGSKEVTVGKGGLTQLVREKPQIQKQEILQKQKVEQVQKQVLKQEQKPKVLQKQKQEQILIPKLKQKQSQILIPKPKQKQKQGLVIPISQPKNKPRNIPILIPKQPQKQKQGGGYPLPVPIITTPTFGIPPPIKTPPPPRIPPPTIRTPPTQPPEPPRKPPFFPGLGIKPGALGRVGKGGNRLGYIGNVPITSIVGVYKRSEITYGGKVEKFSKTASPNTSKLSSKKGKNFRF